MLPLHPAGRLSVSSILTASSATRPACPCERPASAYWLSCLILYQLCEAILVLQKVMIYLPLSVHPSCLLLHVPLVIIPALRWFVCVQLCTVWCIPDPANNTAATWAPTPHEARPLAIVSAGWAHHAWPDISASGWGWASQRVSSLRVYMEVLLRYHPALSCRSHC